MKLEKGKGQQYECCRRQRARGTAGVSRQDRHHIWHPAGGLECCPKETDMENWKSPVQKSGTGHPDISGYVF